MHAKFKIASLILMYLLLCLSISAQTWQEQSLNGTRQQTIFTRLVDWDNDGDLDIIALERTDSPFTNIERGWTYRLVWYKNTPSKSFSPQLILEHYLENPINFEVVDFDGNGKKDVLFIANGLTWFQSQADGSYIPWAIKPNRQILSYQIIDLNRDGQMDLLASFRSGTDPSRVAFFLNDGKGNFREVPMLNGSKLERAQIGDMNQDGNLDLVAMVPDQKAGFKIFYGKGELNFEPPVEIHYDTWDRIEDFHLVDYNLDGKLDIAFLSKIDREVIILDGSRNFKENPDFKIALQGQRANSGYALPVDFDQDGFLDCLYAGRYDDGLIQIRHHDGRIDTIEQGFDIYRETMITTGDLDGDGDLDIVYAANDHFIWLENIRGNFYTHLIFGIYEAIHDIKMIDYDLDGDDDIFMACADEYPGSSGREGVYLWENLGKGVYKDWFIMPLDHEQGAVQYFDVDEDGDLDIVGVSQTMENIQICLNNLAPHAWKVQNAVSEITSNQISAEISNNNLHLINWTEGDTELDIYSKEKYQDQFIQTSLDPGVGPIVHAQLFTPDATGKTYLLVLGQDTAQSLTVFEVGDDWELSAIYTFKGYNGIRASFLTSKTKQNYFVFHTENEEDAQLFILLFQDGKFAARRIFQYERTYFGSSTWVSLAGDELYFQDEKKYYKINLNGSNAFKVTPQNLPSLIDPFVVTQLQNGEVQQVVGGTDDGLISIFRKKN